MIIKDSRYIICNENNIGSFRDLYSGPNNSELFDANSKENIDWAIFTYVFHVDPNFI